MGKDLSLTVTNVLLTKSKTCSKLVNFSKLSSHRLSPINKSDVSVVENLNLPAYTMKNDFPHLKDIKLEQLHDKNISILIGADEPHLHLYTENRIGNTNEPVALLTTLGWVLMGGKSNNSKISTNFLKREWEMLDKSIERFWQTEPYGILKRDDTILMPKQDRKAIEILESIVNKKNNHYTVGLLWKDENIILPYNHSTALSRFHSLEKRLAKNPTIVTKYKDTINDYIEKGHATKLSKRTIKQDFEYR